MATLLSTRLLFLYALTVLATAYTVTAFGMEWDVGRGQIGPGFFPRIVGVLTLLCCLVAIVRALRDRNLPPETAVDADGQPEAVGGRTDARATLATVACMALFYVLFEPLGALLSSILFLGAVLAFVNRGRHRVNVLASVLTPVGLYLVFEVLLDTGLPEGLVSL